MAKKILTVSDLVTAGDNGSLREVFDTLIKSQLGFTPNQSISSAFLGANITGVPGGFKPNTNTNGFIFTTRPDLNLLTENISVDRRMAPLLTSNERSMMRAIRILLSPRTAIRIDKWDAKLPQLIDSPLINKRYPFLAISDNLTKSLTGWPSSRLGVHTSPEGIMKEVHIQADSPASYAGNFSLNLSGLSVDGNPLLYLYYYWILYMGLVMTNEYGVMSLPRYIGNGRMDYTCRHYRFIMDETNTFFNEYACTGYGFPQSIDIGQYMDYNVDEPRPYVGRNVEVEFACSGVMYMDELVLRQFNTTVCIFQPYMGDKHRSKYFVKVPYAYRAFYNNQCYPRANQVTRELEWWVPKDYWNKTESMRNAFVENKNGYIPQLTRK